MITIKNQQIYTAEEIDVIRKGIVSILTNMDIQLQNSVDVDTVSSIKQLTNRVEELEYFKSTPRTWLYLKKVYNTVRNKISKIFK
jgi:hypothetical protein